MTDEEIYLYLIKVFKGHWFRTYYMKQYGKYLSAYHRLYKHGRPQKMRKAR